MNKLIYKQFSEIHFYISHLIFKISNLTKISPRLVLSAQFCISRYPL